MSISMDSFLRAPSSFVNFSSILFLRKTLIEKSMREDTYLYERNTQLSWRLQDGHLFEFSLNNLHFCTNNSNNSSNLETIFHQSGMLIADKQLLVHIKIVAVDNRK